MDSYPFISKIGGGGVEGGRNNTTTLKWKVKICSLSAKRGEKLRHDYGRVVVSLFSATCLYPGRGSLGRMR